VTRPRLLDLFCGAGGCSVGYARAGFQVVGVDNAPQPRYPYEFVQADALTFPLDGYDVIHASPPCQLFSQATSKEARDNHPDYLRPILDRLREHGGLWVVENVPGAPMPGALTLCGSEFGMAAIDRDGRELRLRRHRLFLSSVLLMGAGGCHCANDRHYKRIGGVYGGGSVDRARARNTRRGGYTPHRLVRAALLGIDWPMTEREVNQAIPPAYTQHIGEQLLAHLAEADR
jgi:DNA (cytosine-5)-methyltransferase 1